MKIIQRSTVLSLCMGALIFVSTAASAQLVLDRSETAINYGFFITSPDSAPGQPIRWQEFIAGYDNLGRLDMWITDQHRVDSVLSVWITDSNQETLWSAQIQDALLPASGWLVLNTPRITLVPGMHYRVNAVVDKFPNDHNPAASVYWYGSTTPTTYFLNDVSDDWPTYSYAFATYAVVPEPGVATLLGAGLAFLLAGRWPRRTRADGIRP